MDTKEQRSLNPQESAEQQRREFERLSNEVAFLRQHLATLEEELRWQEARREN